MKKNILLFLLLLGCAVSQAQVGIGVPNPAASAAFEVKSTTKGFLPPRMTATERGAIALPTTGLMIYNTDDKIFEWFDGAVWQGVRSNGRTTITSNVVADYTVVSTDATILCDVSIASFTVTLPVPSTVTGKVYVIRKIDSTNKVLTLKSNGTTVLSLNYAKTVRIQSDGTSWYIID